MEVSRAAVEGFCRFYVNCASLLLAQVFEMSSLCVCNRFGLQDLMLLRDRRATSLWKDAGLPCLVQNSTYFFPLHYSVSRSGAGLKKERRFCKISKTVLIKKQKTQLILERFFFVRHFRGGEG